MRRKIKKPKSRGKPVRIKAAEFDRMYMSGVRYEDIAKRFGWASIGGVANYAKRKGLPPRGAGRPKTQMTDQFMEMWNDDVSYPYMGKALGVHPETIRRMANEHGLKRSFIRGRGPTAEQRRKYPGLFDDKP